MEEEKTILFVDDEASVLSSMRRLLRNEPWGLLFAQSGQEGLEILSETSVDLVVSDMRMPGMDGARFLKEVLESYPETIRIILSGYAEWESVREVIGQGYAQQMLTKPWDEDQLKATLNRLLEQTDKQSEAAGWLRNTLNGLASLPTLPDLYARIQSLLEDESSVSIEKIVHEVEQDPSISVRLLRWANSALFSQVNRVETIHRAIVVLGTEMVQGLVLTMSVFETLGKDNPKTFDLEAFWSHCVGCGILSRDIARERITDQKQADRIFTAGLLHDLGKLVEHHYAEAEFEQAVLADREGECALRDAEKDVFGHDHSEIGGYLCDWWDLPPVISQSVRWHHSPRLSDAESEAVGIVHVANALAHKFKVGASGSSEPVVVDRSVFSDLKLTDSEVKRLGAAAADVSPFR